MSRSFLNIIFAFIYLFLNESIENWKDSRVGKGLSLQTSDQVRFRAPYMVPPASPRVSQTQVHFYAPHTQMRNPIIFSKYNIIMDISKIHNCDWVYHSSYSIKKAWLMQFSGRCPWAHIYHQKSNSIFPFLTLSLFYVTTFCGLFYRDNFTGKNTWTWILIKWEKCFLLQPWYKVKWEWKHILFITSLKQKSISQVAQHLKVSKWINQNIYRIKNESYVVFDGTCKRESRIVVTADSSCHYVFEDLCKLLAWRTGKARELELFKSPLGDCSQWGQFVSPMSWAKRYWDSQRKGKNGIMPSSSKA